MATFVRRPVPVEMVQWTGDNLGAMRAFAFDADPTRSLVDELALTFWCTKAAAAVTIKLGDWIAAERDGVGWYPISKAEQLAGYSDPAGADRTSEHDPVERIRRALAGVELTPREVGAILEVCVGCLPHAGTSI